MTKATAFILAALFFLAGLLCGGGLCYRLEVEPLHAKLDKLEKLYLEETGRLRARVSELESVNGGQR